MTVEQGNVVNAEAAFTQHQLQQQIEAAQQGDMVAYRQLYDRFVGKVYALSYRLTGDAAMAEDATQEVFVQVWQKLGNFSGKSQFATWLHSVTANITISYLRKQKGWLKKGAQWLADKWDVDIAIIRDCKKLVNSEEWVQERMNNDNGHELSQSQAFTKHLLDNGLTMADVKSVKLSIV